MLTIQDTKNEDDKNAQEDSHCKKKVEGRILWRRKKILCDAAVPEWAAAPLICTGTGVGVGKSRLFTGPTLFYHFFHKFVSNSPLSVKKSCLITETDSILSLSVCHKWNGSFTKRLHILIQRNELRFCPSKVSLYINKVKSENGGYLPIVCSWFS